MQWNSNRSLKHGVLGTASDAGADATSVQGPKDSLVRYKLCSWHEKCNLTLSSFLSSSEGVQAVIVTSYCSISIGDCYDTHPANALCEAVLGRSSELLANCTFRGRNIVKEFLVTAFAAAVPQVILEMRQNISGQVLH